VPPTLVRFALRCALKMKVAFRNSPIVGKWGAVGTVAAPTGPCSMLPSAVLVGTPTGDCLLFEPLHGRLGCRDPSLPASPPPPTPRPQQTCLFLACVAQFAACAGPVVVRVLGQAVAAQVCVGAIVAVVTPEDEPGAPEGQRGACGACG
jgi:hypothetical protein